MDRKRHRREHDVVSTPGGRSSSSAASASASASAPLFSSSAASSSSPSVQLLESEVRTLRTELAHSQKIRSMERKNAERSEARLRHRLDDTFEELREKEELIDGLREQVELHGRGMEEARGEWLGRIRWYEERWEEEHQRDGGGKESDGETEVERQRSALLRRKLDASTEQTEELSRRLVDAEERAANAERKASLLALEAASSSSSAKKMDNENRPGGDGDRREEENESSPPRALRIKLAEAERSNRELRRECDEWKNRAKDTAQHRERAATSQRRVRNLEEELRDATRRCEEGREAERRWTAFRREVLEDESSSLALAGKWDDVDDNLDAVSVEGEDETGGAIAQPPELATVLRKLQGLKRTAQRLEDENRTVVRESEARKRRIHSLEQREKEQSRAAESLEKEMVEKKKAMDRLELDHRKLVAQQLIWERESEGMRSLLETFDRQEQRVGTNEGSDVDGMVDPPAAVQAVQVSLTSAKERAKLLEENNGQLQLEIEDLRTQQQNDTVEHKRVMEKFQKLRSALMEERSKAEAAESRACLAETLAGKGSYNEETTRVLHLESNPYAEAVREKHKSEVESLTRRLEDAEEALRNGEGPGIAPFSAVSKRRKDDSLDEKKYHRRLKEKFKEQIALFREGVFLITGFKVDMTQSGDAGDRPRFKVRSIYGEQEEDHLMFEWPRKGNPSADTSLDLLTTDLAQLLMGSPSAIYMTKYESVPAFMAGVQLSLFEKQTMI